MTCDASGEHPAHAPGHARRLAHRARTQGEGPDYPHNVSINKPHLSQMTQSMLVSVLRCMVMRAFVRIAHRSARRAPLGQRR
jgi:hypothetical protein